MDRDSGARVGERRDVRPGPRTARAEQAAFAPAHDRTDAPARHAGLRAMWLRSLSDLDPHVPAPALLLSVPWDGSLSAFEGRGVRYPARSARPSGYRRLE